MEWARMGAPNTYSKLDPGSPGERDKHSSPCFEWHDAMYFYSKAFHIW